MCVCTQKVCMHQVSVASILFIDNPVGTGYSYVTKDSAFTTDVQQIAQDLMATITAFLKQLPEFQVEAFVPQMCITVLLMRFLVSLMETLRSTKIAQVITVFLKHIFLSTVQ